MVQVITTVLVIGLTASAFADDKLDALTKRVEELELQQEQLLLAAEEPRPKAYSFLNNNLTFGGFFEPGYTVITGKDTNTQAGTSNILAVNIAADFKSGFKFVGQYLTALGVGMGNQHNDPRAASATFPSDREFNNPVFATLLTQGYVEYSSSRAFHIQGGLGYVPFGYAFQERELVLFVRRGGPQMLRTNDLVQPLWTGINILGSFAEGPNTWGYNFYTFSPTRNLGGLGVGGRAWWASNDENVVVGVSAQEAKGKGENYEVVGADVKVEVLPFIIRSEYAYQFSDQADPWSVYVEPGMFVMDDKLLVYVFGDYANDGLNKTASVLSDPIQKWEYGGGVNWLPTTFTRFRFGVTYNDYVGTNSIINGQQRDYWSVDISAGIAF